MVQYQGEPLISVGILTNKKIKFERKKEIRKTALVLCNDCCKDMREQEKFDKAHEECKRTNCDVYSRVVGYYQPTRSWNPAKQEEFKDRKVFDVAR